jgi:hypothetical protein
MKKKNRRKFKMKITKNNAGIPEGTLVLLPSEELLIIKAIFREPDGLCYRVQFVEEDGDEYIPIGEPRIMWHDDMIGAEV